MGYPRNIRHLDELEAFEVILAVDQDLEFFADHPKAPENRPFVAVPIDLARVLLIPMSRQYHYARWDDIVFLSSKGQRSLISLSYQETVYWDDLLDSNKRYFGRRHVRVIDKLPTEVIKELEDHLRGITP